MQIRVRHFARTPASGVCTSPARVARGVGLC
jgi:hypothetical protein